MKQNAILKRIKKKKKKHFKIDSTPCFTTCLNTKAYLSGTCKMRNEIETKRNEINRNETKFTETKRNRNEIDRNETKRNNSK